MIDLNDSRDLPKPLPIPLGRWFFGAILLAGAMAATGPLVILRIYGTMMPGCSIDRGCQAAESGPWSQFSVWPTAFFGMAYFCGLTAAWMVGLRGGVSSLLRWTVRLGVVVSLAFAGLMTVEQHFCPFCAAVHTFNLLFWILVETVGANATNRVAGMNAFLGAFGFAIVAVSTLQSFETRRKERQQLADFESAVAEINESMTANRSDAELDPALRRPAYVGSGKLHVVVFLNYRCPACRMVDEVLAKLVASGAPLFVTVKPLASCVQEDLVLSESALDGLDPRAAGCFAARLLLAAEQLGGPAALWKTHQELIEAHGDVRSATTTHGLLAKANEQETLDKVASIRQDAKRLGIKSTPTVYINGVEVQGNKRRLPVEAVVDAVVEKRR